MLRDKCKHYTQHPLPSNMLILLLITHCNLFQCSVWVPLQWGTCCSEVRHLSAMYSYHHLTIMSYQFNSMTMHIVSLSHSHCHTSTVNLRCRRPWCNRPRFTWTNYDDEMVVRESSSWCICQHFIRPWPRSDSGWLCFVWSSTQWQSPLLLTPSVCARSELQARMTESRDCRPNNGLRIL